MREALQARKALSHECRGGLSEDTERLGRGYCPGGPGCRLWKDGHEDRQIRGWSVMQSRAFQGGGRPQSPCSGQDTPARDLLDLATLSKAFDRVLGAESPHRKEKGTQ